MPLRHVPVWCLSSFSLLLQEPLSRRHFEGDEEVSETAGL